MLAHAQSSSLIRDMQERLLDALSLVLTGSQLRSVLMTAKGGTDMRRVSKSLARLDRRADEMSRSARPALPRSWDAV